jgi:hypothetical protein
MGKKRKGGDANDQISRHPASPEQETERQILVEADGLKCMPGRGASNQLRQPLDDGMVLINKLAGGQSVQPPSESHKMPLL